MCKNPAVRGAAVGSVLAAAAASPVSGWAAFWPLIKVCMLTKLGDRVEQILGETHAEEGHGPWTSVAL